MSTSTRRLRYLASVHTGRTQGSIMSTHQWIGYGVTRHPVTHSACCSCGWRSEPMSTAGLAASLWDGHRDETAESGQLGAPVDISAE